MAERKAAHKRHMSVNDMLIQKYLDNKERMKELKEENDRIKAQWEHKGSFSTNHFMVTVKKSRYYKAPNKEELIKQLGDEARMLFVRKTRTDYIVEEK